MSRQSGQERGHPHGPSAKKMVDLATPLADKQMSQRSDDTDIDGHDRQHVRVKPRANSTADADATGCHGDAPHPHPLPAPLAAVGSPPSLGGPLQTQNKVIKTVANHPIGQSSELVIRLDGHSPMDRQRPLDAVCTAAIRHTATGISATYTHRRMPSGMLDGVTSSGPLSVATCS